MTNHIHRPAVVWCRVAITFLALSRGAAASEQLQLVSPGSEDEPLAVSSPCPTFSWGRDRTLEAASLELAILRVEGSRIDSTQIGEPVLIERLPGSATTWTPPGASCLEAGADYAWSLRALQGLEPDAATSGEWAEPHFFSVPALPGDAQIRQALEVLRSAGMLKTSAVQSTAAAVAPDTAAARSRVPQGHERSAAATQITSALPLADRSGMKASLLESPEIGFGIHGVTATTGVGSAGVVGEATATAGPVHGVIGVTHSAEGVAGRFENSAGGPILSGLGAAGEVFSVDPAGVVSAASFSGSGSGLANLQWGSLANVPTGFDDGVDHDTTYQAGTGLGLSGTTLRVTSLPMEMYIEEQKIATATIAEDPSIIIGRDGLPLITYYEANTGELKVVHCKDTICSQRSSSTIDSTGIVGQHNAITLGRDGNPLISYYDASGNQLKLAHCHDVECSSADVTVVDSSGDVGQYTSITTDSSGYAFISYYDAAGALKAARCSNLTCSARSIWQVDSGGVGEYTSVTRNYSGYGFISYYDAGNGDLKLARCPDMNCSSPTLYVVDATDDTGQQTAITTAADGHPLIAYAGTNAAGSVAHIRVAHCNSHVSCSSPAIDQPTVGTGSTRFLGISITRGADGLGVITSTFNSTSRVYTLHCKDIACSDSTIADDTVNNGAVDAAITIGSDRLPIIAYTSDQDGDLFIAHCSDSGCQPYLREP